MTLSDGEITALLRELVLNSYSGARPRGMRAVRADDLLALAQRRFDEAITEADLDRAVARIGGGQAELTSTRYLIAGLLRRGNAWRRAYLIPAHTFDGLKLPSRFRTPRRQQPR